MSEGLRQRLEAKREEAINEAVERLLVDDNAEVRKIIRRVEVYSRLLAAIKPPRSREWIWAVIVAVLCLSVGGLLWSFQITRTKITLHLTSDAVELKLSAPWSWSGDLPLETSLVQLEALSVLEASLLGSTVESSRSDVSVAIKDGSVSLKRLGLERNGVLTVERTANGHIDLYSRGAKLWGLFIVLGSVHLSVESEITDPRLERHFDLAIPESIAFQAKGDTAVPTRIKVRPREPWALRELQVQDLGFMRETPAEPGAIVFMSAITQGTLTLHDSSETVVLREKDRLILTGLKGRVVELKVRDAIDLIFEGMAKRILIGPNGFEQNLAPTYLTYIYHQKPLAFFWGAVVFCWGVLWSVRRTIFG
jgi:hypothetical protein